MATTIGKKIQQAKADGRVTKGEVEGLIQQAEKNKIVSKAEKKELTGLLKGAGDSFDTDARAALTTFLGDSRPVQAPEAKIAFGADWEEPFTGKLVAGGRLVLEYDPARASLRNTHNGHPAWGVDAFVKLVPSGKIIETRAVDFVVTDSGHRTPVAKAVPVSVTIPKGTTEVQVWFRNWTGASNPAEQWDSNYGGNYCFKVDSGS